MFEALATIKQNQVNKKKGLKKVFNVQYSCV